MLEMKGNIDFICNTYKTGSRQRLFSVSFPLPLISPNRRHALLRPKLYRLAQKFLLDISTSTALGGSVYLGLFPSTFSLTRTVHSGVSLFLLWLGSFCCGLL